MEIERKFLIDQLPQDIDKNPKSQLSQAYICTNPVIRVRRQDDSYILTIKSGGLMARQETEFPLGKEAYHHLLEKADGIIIEKTRYRIPDTRSDKEYLIELDIFEGIYEGFIMAEVEFSSVEEALAYTPPGWFGPDVTKDSRFHNSNLSRRSPEEAAEFINQLKNF